MGATALGTTTGVLLLVGAATLWFRPGAPGAKRVVFCGVLFGLAAGSRFDLCLFAPAFLLISCFDRNSSGRISLRFPIQEMAVAILALGIFVANVVLLPSLTPDAVTTANLARLMEGTGTTSPIAFLDYPRQLNKVLIGQSFAPLVLLILASLLPFWNQGAGSVGKTPVSRFQLFLLAAGWTFWCGWFFQAPIPHLRYAWPALVCFAILAGHGLASLYRNAQAANKPLHALGLLTIAAALVLGGTLGTFRSVVMGESNYISWEWSREMPADYFRRFQHLKDQRDTMDFLRQLPEDATIICFDVPYTYRYLTHRPIIAMKEYRTAPKKQETVALLQQAARPGRLPVPPTIELQHDEPVVVYLVMPPAIGTYLQLPREGFQWVGSNGDLAAQFGRYSVYELRTPLPRDVEFLRPIRLNYRGHPKSIPWQDWDKLYQPQPR